MVHSNARETLQSHAYIADNFKMRVKQRRNFFDLILYIDEHFEKGTTDESVHTGRAWP